MSRVYLDNNATTPPLPAVVEAMLPYWHQTWANPGSGHADGLAARAGMDDARARVAAGLGCQPSEVVFTGSGTESDVMAVVGVARARRASTGANRVVSTAVEHPAVLAALRVLEAEGFDCVRVGVDAEGLPPVDALTDAITAETAVVSIMLANNETGGVLPVLEAAQAARSHGVPIHCDAVNACGKWPATLDGLGVDLLSISGHKFHGPRGVGALAVRAGTPIQPLMVGGGHEHGLRSGTENVAGIVALAAALDAALDGLDDTIAAMRARTDRLHAALRERVPDLALNGPADPARRLPNTLNVSLPGRSGADVADALDAAGISVSTGAACHDGDRIGSHVMEAMGLDLPRARGAIRISLSRLTTDDELTRTLAAFDSILG